ncbi:aspartyl protease family protein [Mucilaginibacter mali]|uniref:Aspartyl protease family protein n=1 Tax=Mucilaginibacter mali TaxID=2740462 RepID=A0A7D4UFG8_9SPHI|nr:aspartyl protease family protein [Mucilaginibacter mali]QKJ32739.1 aspartyl protease family protein [Mucilaginibacter mali]
MQINVITRNICHHGIKLLFILILACPLFARSQSFELEGNKKRVSFPFRTVRNMVIVSLKINDRGPFNFILDTGVGLMLITAPTMVDSINLQSKRTIKMYGLNGDSYEAFITPNLKVELPHISSNGVAAAILKEDRFSLSNYAGMPIHGLLGYEFFSNLAVRFNFYDSTMTVSKPQYVRLLRKGNKIPLTIEDKKPYMETYVKMPDGTIKKRKLLVDLGAGHPLSLENMLKEQGLPENFIAANLGVGLTGPVQGYISRVTELDLGSYKLKDVVTSFPDMEYLKQEMPLIPRDGSIGFGVLKRFTVIIDYANNAMYLKKADGFSDPFEHDMTGMEYYFDGQDYGHLIVGRVEPGSAADNVGIQKDDEIIGINFRDVGKMSIEQIDGIFRSRDGRNLLLDVYRNKEYRKVILTLKKRI